MNNKKNQKKTEAYSNEISNVTGWKSLAEELKKYNGIKEAVRNQTSDLNKLRDKYLVLLKDLKNLSALYQTAYYLINVLDSYFFYFKGYLDQNQNKYGFNIIPSRTIIRLIILTSHPDNDHKEKKNENSSIDQFDGNTLEAKYNKKREGSIGDTS